MLTDRSLGCKRLRSESVAYSANEYRQITTLFKISEQYIQLIMITLISDVIAIIVRDH